MKPFTTLFSLCLVHALFSASAADPPESLRVFYFGNSLTGSAMPDFHEKLGESAGKRWICDAFLGAGWQTWQHRNELWQAMGRPVDAGTQSASSRGDLTLDDKLARAASFKPRRFLEGEWDAIVIQVFGTRLHHVTDRMWGSAFEGPVDAGDVAAAADIIRTFLKKNPEGRAFIYTVWPSMPGGAVPPDDQLPEWAIEMKKRSGKIREAEFPDREGFDYAVQWEKSYQGDYEKPWIGNICRTRDYTSQVFEGIRKEFPELWKRGRLTRIPGGELFFELDKKMRAGAMPGITTIEDYYTDVQHIRAGLPAYSVAALFYAALFQADSGSLDFSLYNDSAQYGPDMHHDRGEVIPITPDRAKVVHETIREILARHPHCPGYEFPSPKIQIQ